MSAKCTLECYTRTYIQSFYVNAVACIMLCVSRLHVQGKQVVIFMNGQSACFAISRRFDLSWLHCHSDAKITFAACVNGGSENSVPLLSKVLSKDTAYKIFALFTFKLLQLPCL